MLAVLLWWLASCYLCPKQPQTNKNKTSGSTCVKTWWVMSKNVRCSHEKSEDPPQPPPEIGPDFGASAGRLIQWGSNLWGKTAADRDSGPAAEMAGRRRVPVVRPRWLLELPLIYHWLVRMHPSTLRWSRSPPPTCCPGSRWARQYCPSPLPPNLDGQDKKLHRTQWVALSSSAHAAILCEMLSSLSHKYTLHLTCCKLMQL